MMGLHEIKTCPRCYTAFECKAGNITQCQCFSIRLTEEQKAYIDQRYTDCLCSNCLQGLANELDLFKERYIFR